MTRASHKQLISVTQPYATSVCVSTTSSIRLVAERVFQSCLWSFVERLNKVVVGKRIEDTGGESPLTKNAETTAGLISHLVLLQLFT